MESDDCAEVCREKDRRTPPVPSEPGTGLRWFSRPGPAPGSGAASGCLGGPPYPCLYGEHNGWGAGRAGGPLAHPLLVFACRLVVNQAAGSARTSELESTGGFLRPAGGGCSPRQRAASLARSSPGNAAPGARRRLLPPMPGVVQEMAGLPQTWRPDPTAAAEPHGSAGPADLCPVAY